MHMLCMVYISYGKNDVDKYLVIFAFSWILLQL